MILTMESPLNLAEKQYNGGINKVAVIGSGIMGAGIAAHCANAGCDVLLYDIAPKEAEDKSRVISPAFSVEVRVPVVNCAIASISAALAASVIVMFPE